jgi:flagellar hook-associated protein 1 FlgK
MGLISSALQIGRSAVLSYQAVMEIVGNNISNAGNPDYTRQSAGLSARPGVLLANGLQPGAGVALSSLKRNLDESLEGRIRAAIGDQESAAAQAEWVGRIETFFDELSGAGISSCLTEFFNSLAEVQNNPEDVAIRGVAIANGTALAGSLRRLREEVVAIGNDINEQIIPLVEQANAMAEQIADLNAQIVAAEAAQTSQAGALRDQRDALLRDLSELFDVTVRIQDDQSITVYIGSEPLVQGGLARQLATQDVLDGEVVRTEVRFADSNAQIQIHGGRMYGLMEARESLAYARIAGLDQLAAGLIAEVNRVHANGQGLVGFTSVTGTYDVDDVTAALNSPEAGLKNGPQNGSFFIVVSDDATGTPVAYQIDVDLDGIDDDTTLESLVAQINDVTNGITASITPDHRLSLAADDGYSFTFGHDGVTAREDTAHLLAALGINTFFDGSTAGDIQVNPIVDDDASMLSASTTNLSGDGANAGQLAMVLDQASDELGGVSILDFYNGVANDVAVAGAAAQNDVEATGAILSALQTQKENISGVSLDEEAVEMIKFERAFQGAARYLSVVDQMLAEMLNIIR